MRKTTVRKRMLAGMLSAVLTVTALPLVSLTRPQKEVKAASVTLQNPRIVKDDSMEAGQKVTWDCIYFGSYPQREIVADKDTYQAIYGESADFDKDAIEDEMLSEKLEQTEGWDANNEIIWNGDRYRRMKRANATYKGMLFDELGTWRSEYFYCWDNDSDWHYFKYEPIKWRVLSVEEDKAFLISDQVLDNQRYTEPQENFIWKNSTIRDWLNSYSADQMSEREDHVKQGFLNSAFNEDEQEAIFTSDIENADNLEYGTEGGEDTEDKIFLLSEKEVYASDEAVSSGFTKTVDKHEDGSWTDICDEAKRSKSSTYAKAMGTSYSDKKDYIGNSGWWLRSPGSDPYSAACVDEKGIANRISFSDGGVRPALKVDLSFSGLWSYAGNVDSNGYARENGSISEDGDKTTESGLIYRVYSEGGHAEITGYNGSEKNLIIPDTLDGVPVTSIGQQAFVNCTVLESVEIPDSITRMGYWVFSGCSSLKQVRLSKNLKYINMDCFSECSSLESIMIPEGVTQLAPGAFMHCTNLKKIELPSTLEGIYEHAFARCTNLTQITIPEKVKVIAYGAFLGCDNLKDIYYPGTNAQWNTIKIVENDNDILKTAAIHYRAAEPSSTEPLNPQPSNPSASDAFLKDNLASNIRQGDAVKVKNAEYRITRTGTLKTAEYKKAASKTQKNVRIPAAVTINGEVYKVTSIAKNACKGNKKLKTVTVGKNIKTIGANAFAGCKNLKTIRIASTSLTKKSVGKNAFKGIHKKAVIKVPKKKLKAYQKFLKGKGQAKSVKIKKQGVV